MPRASLGPRDYAIRLAEVVVTYIVNHGGAVFVQSLLNSELAGLPQECFRIGTHTTQGQRCVWIQRLPTDARVTIHQRGGEAYLRQVLMRQLVGAR